MATTRILIVDDNIVTTKNLVALLQKLGYFVLDTVFSGEEALQKLPTLHPDLVLVDIQLGQGMDGITLAEYILYDFHVPVVYLTAHADPATLERAKLTEPFGYLLKPCHERELQVTIETALYKHKTEADLARQKALLTDVFENVQEGTALVDECGNILFCNPAYADIVEVDPYSLAGRNAFEFLEADARVQVVQEMKERQERKSSTYEIPLMTMKEQPKYVRMTVMPRFDQRGSCVGEFVTMLDITDRRRAEERLQEQNLMIEEQRQQLYDLNARKDKFIAIISHDLRNLFSGLFINTELLKQSVNNLNKDDIQAFVNRIQTTVENLHALLENLFTWAQIQQGHIEYHPRPTNLSQIVVKNINLLTPLAEHKQITFEYSVPTKHTIYADSNMLDTVIRNLLSNALKFTGTDGRITIRFTPGEIEETLAVSDTGIGIPPEHFPKIFLIDAKYKRTGTAGEQGTGLGLIFCKEFVEQHGGRRANASKSPYFLLDSQSQASRGEKDSWVQNNHQTIRRIQEGEADVKHVVGQSD